MTTQPSVTPSLDTILERNQRDLFAFQALNPLDQQREQLRNKARYTKDPWQFLSECVFTLDQVSQSAPIKPFPSYLAYCKFLTRIWMRDKLLAVPKSRRMICSWTFISLYTGDTIFNSGRFNALVSKKEDDSSDLVGRAEFIYRNIPKWRLPRELLPALKNGRMSKQPPLMEFEDIHSKLQGFPQGADQMRQFTFSGMLFDEWAFWDEAQPSYSAAKPTLDGGGRLTGISSRSPGFFKKICYDQLDAVDLTFQDVAPVTPEHVMEGVDTWTNPKNGFTVIDLHYTADPKKRGDAWREAVRQSMPKRDYEMEYEKSWQTFEGKPVYSDYTKSIHVKSGKIAADVGVPLILGVDFGLTPAFVITQPSGRRLRVLKEFLEANGSIDKLGNVVYNYLFQHYLPWFNGEDLMQLWIDPAGFQKAQTDARTCAGILREIFGVGVKIRPGPVNWEPRRKGVEDFLTKTYGEGPGLEISEEECPILVEGFGGGYRYADNAVNIEPTLIRPLKNKYSHPHDALQYACFGATALRKQYGLDTKMSVPSYGFQSITPASPKEIKSYGTGT